MPEPSRRFNLLFTVEGSGIQGTITYTNAMIMLSSPDFRKVSASIGSNRKLKVHLHFEAFTDFYHSFYFHTSIAFNIPCVPSSER